MAPRKKNKKTWVYVPPKKEKQKIPDGIKIELEAKANNIVEGIFKPQYIKPIPEEFILNHVIDIYTKWYRNYFYFCSKYKCPPDSMALFFESKFARMEYIGNNEFELSYMRHTGQWWPLGEKSMEDCLKYISTMMPY